MAGDITTIARPYAEALFQRAQETGQQTQWSDTLALLSTIVQQEQIAVSVDDPNVPRELAQDLILEIAGEALSQEGQNLVRLLADNRRLAVLPHIAALFEQLKIKSQGVTDVIVRSAYALNASQQNELAAALKRKLGGEVELTVEKDPSLIGGVEIRAGDLVIDGTVRDQLQKLANELHI